VYIAYSSDPIDKSIAEPVSEAISMSWSIQLATGSKYSLGRLAALKKTA